MKRFLILLLLVGIVYGNEYIDEIDRNGIFSTIPNQVSRYLLSIRGNNYVKIKASPVNCKVNIYNEKKHLIGTTSLIDFGYQGRLEDGNYYFSIEPLKNECRSFEITTQEEAFFTISNNHKDQNILIEEKQISQTLIKTDTMAEESNRHIDADLSVQERKVKEKERLEEDKAKKALLEQMKH